MKQETKGIFEEKALPEEAWESAAPLIDHIISNYHHPLVVVLRNFGDAFTKRPRRPPCNGNTSFQPAKYASVSFA